MFHQYANMFRGNVVNAGSCALLPACCTQEEGPSDCRHLEHAGTGHIRPVQTIPECIAGSEISNLIPTLVTSQGKDIQWVIT